MTGTYLNDKNNNKLSQDDFSSLNLKNLSQ